MISNFESATHQATLPGVARLCGQLGTLAAEAESISHLSSFLETRLRALRQTVAGSSTPMSESFARLVATEDAALSDLERELDLRLATLYRTLRDAGL